MYSSLNSQLCEVWDREKQKVGIKTYTYHWLMLMFDREYLTQKILWSNYPTNKKCIDFKKQSTQPPNQVLVTQATNLHSKVRLRFC